MLPPSESAEHLLPWRHFRDSDELSAAFSPWGMDLVQMKRERGDQKTGSIRIGDIRIWATKLTGQYRVRTGLPDRSVLMQFNLGRHRTRRIGNVLIGHDDVLTGFAGLDMTGVLTENHCGISFVLPDAVVSEALSCRAPGAEELMRRRSPYVLSGAGDRIDALRSLTEEALALSDERACQFASVDIFDMLLSTLLSPWHREADARFRAPTFQRLPILRRVEEFMRARLGERLMLHDICGAARASQRTVEYAFNTIYGVGPKQYLKFLRLNAVRQVIKFQPQDVESIIQIANRHGLWHMGHFSTDYRLLFGETPLQTRSRHMR